MLQKNLKNEVEVFDLIDRCGIHLDQTSSLSDIHNAIDEVKKLCYCMDLNYDIFKLPCFTMHSKHISMLLVLNGLDDARLIPNRDYFHILSNIMRSKSMLTWTETINCNDKKCKIRFEQGVFKLDDQIILPLAYLYSLHNIYVSE